MPGTRLGLVFLLVLFSTQACEKAPAALPQRGRAAASVASASAPSGVLLSAQMAAPTTQLRGLAELADQLQPGAGLMLGKALLESSLGGLVGLPNLAGVNLDQPLYVLLLNPKVHPQPFVLVATVTDAKALQKSVAAAPGGLALRIQRDRAALGAKAALDDVGAYALGALLDEPLAKRPTVTVHMSALLGAFHDEIAQVKQQLAGLSLAGGAPPGYEKLLAKELDALLALGQQTERAWLSVDGGVEGGTLELGFVPRAGSVAAAFIAAQRPSSYPLLAKLPMGPQALAFAGHLEMGPLRARLMPLVEWCFTEFLGKKADARMLKDMDAWISLLTGEYAGLMNYVSGEGIGMTQLWGVTSGAKAQKLTQSLFARWVKSDFLKGFGVKAKMSWKPKAWKHAGVTVGEQSVTFDSSTLSEPEKAYIQTLGASTKTFVAAYDSYLGMTSGQRGKESLQAMIDASRQDKDTLVQSPALFHALEASRAQGESLIVFVDLLQVMAKSAGSPSGIALGIGFPGGQAKLRVHVPAHHIKSLREVM